MQQLPKLSSDLVEELKSKKNLLAFSGGTDSSALFFILQSLHVNFDIALVNYQSREQSKQEEKYAQNLAKQYGKICYIHTCKLESTNFEHNARIERYNFFEKIIAEHSYDNLLTAHHLNDKLEWFLMQLSRGAGLVEMVGMRESENRENYTLKRPLLHVSKEEINQFLHVNNIKHFLDSSNSDKKYFRNQIRESYASSFVKEFKEGIQKSFKYLEKDARRLLPKDIKQIKQLYILKRDEDDLINIRGIDRIVKKLGVLLSKDTKDEILRTKDCIVSSKIAIGFSEDKIYIAPYSQISMDKKFKEACRIAKIPKKVRAYMYKEKIAIS